MRKFVMAAGAALSILAAGATPALAQHHSFSSGGFHGGGFRGGGFRGGGFRGGGYRYGGGWGYGALGFALGAASAPYWGGPYGYDYGYPYSYGDCGYWRWDPYWHRQVWVDEC